MFNRVPSRPAIYLYTSALLGFVAAILDLSQVLVRGTVNTDDGTDLNSVSGLITAREIGLALSFGFRYLFLWSFVSERPRGEPPPLRAPPGDSGRFDVRNDFHSADWRRWGILGLILKWSLLAQVIAIALMQIIWRTVKTQDQYGPLYMAEATVQIVASALFLMKLKLNIFLSPFTPLWRPLRYFAAPMVATLISIGIGIGNLDFCELFRNCLDYELIRNFKSLSQKPPLAGSYKLLRCIYLSCSCLSTDFSSYPPCLLVFSP